jgi:hypothetical protein
MPQRYCACISSCFHQTVAATAATAIKQKRPADYNSRHGCTVRSRLAAFSGNNARFLKPISRVSECQLATTASTGHWNLEPVTYMWDSIEMRVTSSIHAYTGFNRTMRVGASSDQRTFQMLSTGPTSEEAKSNHTYSLDILHKCRRPRLRLRCGLLMLPIRAAVPTTMASNKRGACWAFTWTATAVSVR